MSLRQAIIDVLQPKLEEQRVGGYAIDKHIAIRRGNKYHKTVDNVFTKKSDAEAFAKKYDGFIIPQSRGRFLVGLNKVTEETVTEDRMAGKYKKGQMIVQGQWPNPDKWAKEYIIPNADGKGVRIYAKGPSFKIEKL